MRLLLDESVPMQLRSFAFPEADAIRGTVEGLDQQAQQLAVDT